MLDRGFGLHFIWGSDNNLCGCGCAVATRDKTVMLGLRMLVLLTLHTLLNALVCCLQLNTERCADAIWKVD